MKSQSEKDKETSGHVKAAIIGGVFALLAAIIGGIFLILNTMVDKGTIGIVPSTASTTSTVVSSNSPITSATQPTANISSVLYDDFNDPAYDGKYNSALWSVRGKTGTTQIYQQGGMLIVSDTANMDGEGVMLIDLKNWKESSFSFFQAKVMLSSEHEGNDGAITLDAQSYSTHDIPGDWTELGISQYRTGGFPYIAAKLGNGEGYTETKSQYDKWVTLKIVFDNTTNEFTYFVDGQLLTWIEIPTQGSGIKFNPVIDLWHKRGTSVKAFIDDVMIGLDK